MGLEFVHHAKVLFHSCRILATVVNRVYIVKIMYRIPLLFDGKKYQFK
jgi:hypothetical protein